MNADIPTVVAVPGVAAWVDEHTTVVAICRIEMRVMQTGEHVWWVMARLDADGTTTFTRDDRDDDDFGKPVAPELEALLTPVFRGALTAIDGKPLPRLAGRKPS